MCGTGRDQLPPDLCPSAIRASLIKCTASAGSRSQRLPSSTSSKEPARGPVPSLEGGEERGKKATGLLSHSFACLLVCLFCGALCWALVLLLATAKETESERLSSWWG